MKKKALTEEQKEDSKRLKALYEAKKQPLGLSQAIIAKALGVQQTAVSHILTGKNPLNVKRARDFARLLEVPVSEFSPSLAAEINQLAQNVSIDTTEHAGYSKLGLIPVTGDAHLGVDGMIEAITIRSDFLSIHSTDPGAYAVQVKGDTLWPRIRNGEFLVIEPGAAIEAGKDVLLKTNDGRIMVKQLFYIKGEMYQLIDINQNQRPITIALSDIQEIHCIAAIVGESKLSI